MPLTAFSIGTVTSASTSVVDRPGASVWISTSGGANSGNTSSGTSSAVCTPTTISTAAAASTSTRNRSDAETNQLIHFIAPNSVPNSSAAPAVTTSVPSAGP